MNEIVEILAFLAAQKDYSYIDRLGNALDEISIMESIRDAIRAYYALCRESSGCIDIGGGKGVKCPQISDASLEKAVNTLSVMLANKPRTDVVKLARELSLKAYARMPSVLSEENLCKPG